MGTSEQPSSEPQTGEARAPIPGVVTMTNKITQYGVTWTFDKEYPAGVFANGDYWVIGPVTLISISPSSVVTNSAAITGMTANGSMINPVSGWWPAQGFDSRIGGYTEELNIARKNGAPLSTLNPRVVAVNSSICSSTSRLTATAGEHSFLNDFAVLTVVVSAPNEGSFRPPYIGTDKSIKWNKSQLDYSILKKLPPAQGMYPPTSSQFARPWVQVSTQYNNARDFSAVNNQVEYDRDMGWAIGSALLELHQDYTNAEKELAYIRMVQYGIDVYASVKYGQHTHTNGVVYQLTQENTGPKGAVVLAALALNDADMKFYSDAANKVKNPWGSGEMSRWGPDGMTEYINESYVGKDVRDQYLTEDRQRLTYTQQMIGLPEWNAGGSNWNSIYRNVRYSGAIGIVLATQLTTGAKALWNWSSYFDYFDRAFVNYAYESGNDQSWPGFVKPWWISYRSLGAPLWIRTAPISGIGWIPRTGDKIVIEYTDIVKTGVDGNGGISIKASGGAVTATYESGSPSFRLTYNLSRVIGPDETLTYSYVQPGNGITGSISGLVVPTATDVSVVNYSGK